MVGGSTASSPRSAKKGGDFEGDASRARDVVWDADGEKSEGNASHAHSHAQDVKGDANRANSEGITSHAHSAGDANRARDDNFPERLRSTAHRGRKTITFTWSTSAIGGPGGPGGGGGGDAAGRARGEGGASVAGDIAPGTQIERQGREPASGGP